MEIPAQEDLTEAATWLAGKLKAENMAIVTRKESQQDNQSGILLEAAIYGSAGDETASFVTNSIFLYHGSVQKQVKKLSGKMAVLVDDCGYDLQPVEALTSLPLKMTFAILPFKDNSTAALEVILSAGREAMLHLPMEPLDAAQMSEQKTVKVSMTSGQIKELTAAAIDSLPGISGVNNHQGSRATADTAVMKAVLSVIGEKGLFFIDSNTTANSVGSKTAAALGIPTGKNGKFLDNSTDPEVIKQAIWAAAELADSNGSVIVICHARPGTVKAWQSAYKELMATGLQFVSVSDLLQ